jgi:hypothetical protein
MYAPNTWMMGSNAMSAKGRTSAFRKTACHVRDPSSNGVRTERATPPFSASPPASSLRTLAAFQSRRTGGYVSWSAKMPSTWMSASKMVVLQNTQRQVESCAIHAPATGPTTGPSS